MGRVINLPSPIFTLTQEEMDLVAYAGYRRRMRNLLRNSQPVQGGFKIVAPGAKPPEPWRCDIEGAAAEYVVHKYANQAWTGLYKRAGADVGDNIGVRQSPCPSAHLIIHPRDRDDFDWVLVTGTCDTPAWTFTIRGWLEGVHCKLPEYVYKKKLPAVEYWVPQSALRQL